MVQDHLISTRADQNILSCWEAVVLKRLSQPRNPLRSEELWQKANFMVSAGMSMVSLVQVASVICSSQNPFQGALVKYALSPAVVGILG